MKSLFKQFLFTTKLYRLNSILNRFYILPFHMIADEPNGFFPEMSTCQFEKQIVSIVRNYNIVSIDEIIEKVKKKEPIRRCVAITFDDGFKDNYKIAYPILRKYHVPATIFLTTGCIENMTAPWFIKVRYMFMKTDRTDIKSFNDKQIIFPMRTKQEKFAASEKVMAHLKNCTDDQRLHLLDRLGMELEFNDFKDLNEIMLDWEEIKTMSENGISFGAHTVNHPVLTRMPLDMVEEEILKSKQTIEDRLVRPVTGFAYPFGKEPQYSPKLFKILQELKFKFAVTTKIGANSYHTEMFALNRSGPWGLPLFN